MIAWVKVMEKTEWTEQVLYTKWVSRVRRNGRNSIFRTHNVNWVFNRSHVGDFFSKKLPHGQDAGQSSDVSTHVTVATWKWESWALPWFSLHIHHQDDFTKICQFQIYDAPLPNNHLWGKTWRMLDFLALELGQHSILIGSRHLHQPSSSPNCLDVR